MVTGLYPEKHGIVSNTMYDPVFNATFRITDPKQVTGTPPATHDASSTTTIVIAVCHFDSDFLVSSHADGRWWGGEPVWVTAEKQGQKAGTYFWYGRRSHRGGMMAH